MATPVEQWVEQVAAHTTPDRIVWCDGSAAENQRLIDEMVASGTLEQLNREKYPHSYLHRSDPSDVARTEHLTFVCTEQQEEAGPNNNWMAPADAKAKVGTLFKGAMKGRTMYVVPYIMGPVASPYSQIGVEITDSPYVVANMRIMTRMGQAALDRLGSSDDFVKGLHSLGDLSPDRRFILHFPEERLIWSVGSGYGGNALLGKKCFALRIASFMGAQQGWMAEHMLIVGIEDPVGQGHLRRRRVPERLRQDQPRDARAAGEPEGLEGVDGRRRHLLDASRARRSPVGDQSGGRFLRRRPRHVERRPTPTRWPACTGNSIFTNVALTDDSSPVVGGHRRPGAGASDRLARQGLGARARARRPRTPTRASPRRRRSARRSPRTGRIRRACRSRPSSSAAAAPAPRRWSCSRSTGTTASSSAPRWPPRRRPPRPARSASCAATRWPCCRSAATTWATTSATG